MIDEDSNSQDRFIAQIYTVLIDKLITGPTELRSCSLGKQGESDTKTCIGTDERVAFSHAIATR